MKSGVPIPSKQVEEAPALDLGQLKNQPVKENADIQTTIKEQDFAEFAKIVHASDEKASYSKDEMNLVKHKKNPHNDRRII
jgi:hypothetical protein